MSVVYSRKLTRVAVVTKPTRDHSNYYMDSYCIWVVSVSGLFHILLCRSYLTVRHTDSIHHISAIRPCVGVNQWVFTLRTGLIPFIPTQRLYKST